MRSFDNYFAINNKAINHFEKALNLKNNEEKQLTTLYLIAEIYLLQQKRNMLAKTIQKGKEIANNYENRRYQYKFFVIDNITERKVSEKTFIDTLKQKIIPYFGNIGEMDEYVNFLTIYSETLYKTGKYKAASENFRLITK